MEYIPQKHSMACGVAAVANAAHVSYDEAARYFDMRYADMRGYHCKNLVSALARLGRSYRFAKVRHINLHLVNRTGSIVFIAQSEQFPYGHWLTRVDEWWIDPWINLAYNPEIVHAQAGLRTTLPGTAEWVVYPTD